MLCRNLRQAINLRAVKNLQPLGRLLSTSSKPDVITEDGTKLKTLQNGIRLAVDETPSHFSAVGMYIDAGSRYEDRYELQGCSHLLDKLAFKSTKDFSDREIAAKLCSLGNNVMSTSSRESILYQGSSFNPEVGKLFQVMSESISKPLLTEDEIEQQKINTEYEIGEIQLDSEQILPEILQQVAFGGKNIGFPSFCTDEALKSINREKLVRYRNLFYKPSKLVVSLRGVPFGQALELTEKGFDGFKDQTPGEKIIKDKAVYTGGEKSLAVPKELAYTGQEFHHLYVGFNGIPVDDPDMYKLAVLQTLIGSGSSFSAGGPGKGMYARAYTRVLNQWGFVESCKAFMTNFTDSGLFGISMKCIPNADSAVVDLLGNELCALMSPDVSRGGISENEVSRAKSQLKSALVMNLESSLVELEDMGRQIQVLNEKTSVREMCSKIDSVTRNDLIDIATKIFTGSNPTVVVQGDREKFGDIAGRLRSHGLGMNAPKCRPADYTKWTN
ncbi:hypothetical protein BRETT_002146 [Brettanomyces bruxellensis]|uniref:Mitochondrial-processing peptidase subunit alpha n=1 Tax=Dekkera bruxellensis TaxID=5007 RepID=A0A871RG75_DEKBR|nr:uncharacterized protein BRETT_002146 [Brettanomyces bruxellensis]QOU21982.1 hypothetical protein BRETT_002146 [Brettanomyces bruxellensis]